MSIMKKTVLSVAVAATTLAAIPAEAGDRWREHRIHRSHDSDGDVVAAGIVGLALGALAVGAIAASREEHAGNPLRHPRPRPDRDFVVDDGPAYVADDGYDDYGPSFEPWSRSWYRYCQQRYRTFDPESGTYVGYDGREHFCNAG